MTTTSAFWDKIADRCASRPVGDVDSYEHTLDRTRNYLSSQDCVLELGCGTGTTALKLAPFTGPYVATDFAARMVSIGQGKLDRATDAPKNLSFEQSDIATAPQGPFDVVLAFNLLHLVPELPRALQQVADRINPGGLMISKTVCLAGSWYYRPLIAVMRLFGKAPFVSYLSIPELERMITDSGFEILETGCFPAKPPSRFIVARKL